MSAATVVGYSEPLEVGDVLDPTCGADDAIIEVEAEGMCRSDWHGWRGESDWLDQAYGLVNIWRPAPPFIAGHELAGTVVELGSAVRLFKVGDGVTLPFNEGCGDCHSCLKGDTQVCSFSHVRSRPSELGEHDRVGRRAEQ